MQLEFKILYRAPRETCWRCS